MPRPTSFEVKDINQARQGRLRDFVDQYKLKDGRRINLLGEGRLINPPPAEGHPASVMETSFANQALGVEYLAREGKGLAKKVHPVSPPIDRAIARLRLASMGVIVDTLTTEQKAYLSSWSEGT